MVWLDCDCRGGRGDRSRRGEGRGGAVGHCGPAVLKRENDGEVYESGEQGLVAVVVVVDDGEGEGGMTSVRYGLSWALVVRLSPSPCFDSAIPVII